LDFVVEGFGDAGFGREGDAGSAVEELGALDGGDKFGDVHGLRFDHEDYAVVA
jgi:hypothetical protein